MAMNYCPIKTAALREGDLPGIAMKSFGLKIAVLVGIPSSVIKRAAPFVDGLAGSAIDQAGRFDLQIKLRGFHTKGLDWREVGWKRSTVRR